MRLDPLSSAEAHGNGGLPLQWHDGEPALASLLAHFHFGKARRRPLKIEAGVVARTPSFGVRVRG